MNMDRFRVRPALLGPLLMLSAALLFTGLNLIIKLLGSHFRVWDIAVYRFLGGIAIILAMVGPRRNPYRSGQIRLLMIRGVTGSIAFLSLIGAIQLLPLSTALVYFYTFPAFAALLSPLLYGEEVTRGGVLCIALVFLGTLILFDFSFEGAWLGQVLAINGGLFAGLTVVLIRQLKATNDSVIIYLYFCTMGFFVCLPAFAQAPVMPEGGREWALCGGLVLTSLTAQVLMNQGFGHCRSWEGGLFMSTEVLFTAVVGITFLGDPLTWQFLAGGSLIVGSVMALNLLEVANVRHGLAKLGMSRQARGPAELPPGSAATVKSTKTGKKW